MLTDLRDLLLHPSAFFSRIGSGQSDLIVPIIIVFFIGVAGFVSNILYIYAEGSVPMDASSLLPGLLSLVARSFTDWILVFVILYLAARVLSGSGTLIKTVQVSGYGMLPFAILPVAGLTVNLAYLPLRQQIYSFGSVRYAFPVHYPIVSFFVWCLFYFWSSYLLMIGIRHSHQVSTGKAVIAVFAVFFVFIVMMYGRAYGILF